MWVRKRDYWKPCSVNQLSHSVVSNSLQPHELQHARLPVHHQLWNLCKLMSIESVMPSNHLVLCCLLPLLHWVFPSIRVFSNESVLCPLPLLPSVFPSVRVFANESALRIRWPKYWSFSFNISPSNEYSGLISFRMDWLDLLAVQGTLKSLLQHHSSKTSILWLSAFFMVQLLHLYISTAFGEARKFLESSCNMWYYWNKLFLKYHNYLTKF